MALLKKDSFIVENEKNPNIGAVERLTKRKMKQVENLKMTTLHETGIRSNDIRKQAEDIGETMI